MNLITRSIGQLQLASPSTADGPINRLSYKLLKAILAQFELQELLPLRLVCLRWDMAIVSIGHTKKSLLLYHDGELFKETLCSVSKRFFGHQQSGFVRIKLPFVVPYLINVRKFGAFLVRLLPRVEQVIIKSFQFYEFHFLFGLWPAHQITTLSLIDEAVNYHFEQSQVEPFARGIITSLAPSLKRLDLVGDFQSLLHLISPIFASLEHFSYHSLVLSKPETNKLYRLFGSNCTQFWLNVSHWRITDLQKCLNPHLLSAVTHLSFQISEDVEPLCQFIADNFTVLRVLQLELPNFKELSLTPSLVSILSRLDNLTELQLYSVVINWDLWSADGVMSKLKPLSTVLECTICFCCNFRMFAPNRQLTHILGAIFPNIQSIAIESDLDPFLPLFLQEPRK